MPRLFRPTLVLAALLGLICTLLAAPSASARVPVSPRHFTSTIEPDTAYVEQDSCDPVMARWGTQHLGNLLTKTYPGSYFYTSRPCDGSTSEHHDGRAIDWMVSARVPAQKAQALAFASWLLASDKYGNTDAMARRLGVMYIIFNGRMWGSWDDKWEEYNGCLHGKLRGAAYDNDCHRTHMHLSLSWNGARGKTSFWTGQVFPTDFGPCVPKGKKVAPNWTAPNRKGCGDHWH